MFKKSLLVILLSVCVSTLQAQTVAYVANFNNNTVSVIDTATNTITATIGVGNTPQGVAFSPDGTRAYVTNLNGATVSVIDTASRSVVATIAHISGPSFAAVTPDGKSLYVPAVDSGNVFVVNTATNSVVATIAAGTFPEAVAFTPDGAKAYVLSADAADNGLVVVIDTATNTVVQSTAVNSDAALGLLPAIAVTPNGGQVYVAGDDQQDVQVIATASNTVVATILFSQVPGGVAITPDGSRVYVSEKFSNAVAVINTATNTVAPSSIPVGNFPFGMAITPDGAFVYVANANDNTVSVISTATNTVVTTVPGLNGPFGVAISPLNAPFASFPAPTPGNVGNPNKIALSGSLSLGANSQGLNFANQPMTLTVGGFSLFFPAGTVTQVGGSSQQHFTFSGTLNGLRVTFDLIGNSPNFTYSFLIQGKNVHASVGPNPVTVILAIGNNSGSTTVNF